MRGLLVFLFFCLYCLSLASGSAVGGRKGRNQTAYYDNLLSGGQPPVRRSTNASRTPVAAIGPEDSTVSFASSVPPLLSSSRRQPIASTSTPTSEGRRQRPNHQILKSQRRHNVSSFVDAVKNTTPVYRLGAVFEPEYFKVLSNVFFQSIQEKDRLSNGSYRLEGLAIETPTLNVSALKGACDTFKSVSVTVGLTAGGMQSIYSAGTLASLSGVPLIARSIRGYRDDTLKNLLPELVVANPRLSDLWDSATSFISALQWYRPILIHDDSPPALLLAHVASRDEIHEPLILSLSTNIPRHHFQNHISGILHTQRRMIFVSGTVNFVKVLFSHGDDLDMFNGEYVWILLDIPIPEALSQSLRPGLLSLRPDFLRIPKRQLLVDYVKSSISVISEFFKEAIMTSAEFLSDSSPIKCEVPYRNLSTSQFEIHRRLKKQLESRRRSSRALPGLTPFFYVENLIPKKTGVGAEWSRIGLVNGTAVQVSAIFWPGRGYKGVEKHSKRLRVAMAEAPPFIMTSPLIENTTCLLGVICIKVFSAEVAATFADMEREVVNASRNYEVVCCSGLSIDLMINVANDLDIQLQVYLVRDGTFGAPRITGWTGVVGDLLDGSAHLSFAPLSVTVQRARHLEFSDPYFYSSVSILSSTRQMEVPLLAFLVPFSLELWMAILVSLNITAFSVAIYEWLSPFGLNPWGRQRSKNFSYGSALWVIWGLLFSHLVAFKAPKSWPNKVLINVWGAFSVIFVASYTANIAALFAGLFQTRYLHDQSLLSLRVGAVRASSAEYYVSNVNPELWHHMKSNLVENFTHGLHKLHSGGLDLLVGDSAILDYIRANDPGCTLRTHGDDLVPDTFSVAMAKGFPLKVKINAALARYQASGHLDHLKHKWYGELPCFRLSADIYKPQALEIRTVAGVFLMLTLGIGVGLVTLILEHIVYRYALPSLRTKPRESMWRNRNLMFFSQKLYKFVNCVELVSPHHSAKELVNNIRTGQIMGLFQKSVKRKENEQRRRRKSKAQFFEMIQEIRRVQKAEKDDVLPIANTTLVSTESKPTSQSATTTTLAPLPVHAQCPLPSDNLKQYPHSSINPLVQCVATTIKPPAQFSQPPISPFSKYNLQPASSPFASITTDYLAGLDPHEDSESVIVFNRSLPPQSTESEEGNAHACWEEDKDHDSGSGILILRVSEPEETLEPNNRNQQLEDTQAQQTSSASCKICSSTGQDENESSHRKGSGGCLNCLQRQDSICRGQNRKINDGGCFPCSGTSSGRESIHSDPRVLARCGAVNGLHHRGSALTSDYQVTTPPLLTTSPLLPPSGDTLGTPGEDDSHICWASRSLDDFEAETSREMRFEGVRLVPLSQQAALKTSGSLQLVAALSPGRERVSSHHLRHVTKADLWRLWQDSERQLRLRLRQAEAQRDDLIRRLYRLAPQDCQESAKESYTVPEEFPSSESRSSLRHDEKDIARKHIIHEAEPILHSVAEKCEEDERLNIHRMRLTEQNTRLRPCDEGRKKNTKGVDISFTPKSRKRHRIKQDSSEPSRNVETDDRLTQHRYANRRACNDGAKKSNSSEDLDATPSWRTKSGRVIDNLGVREIPEGFSGYSMTPLPLLYSLHQHTRTDKSYGPMKLSQLDIREHRKFRETAHFEQASGNTVLEKDAEIILQDDDRYKGINHPRGREEGGGPRRRRIISHPITSYSESHPRRWPKDRHSVRDQSEGRGKKEQEREPRYSSVRKSREKNGRDTNCAAFSGMSSNSHKQHGVRRRPSYESSSEYEEVILRPGTSTSTEIAHDKRQSMPQLILRVSETLQTSSEVSIEKSTEENRETIDSP